MELSYRKELDSQVGPYGAKLPVVRPYGGEEGRGYGEGNIAFTGPKLQGTGRFVNHPHRRSDGVMLPDLHGVLLTEEGATILFTFQGRTQFADRKGKPMLTALFETEDDRYRWLNSALCVLEAVIDAQTLSLRARMYLCVNELV
jgi:hypothetical protein